MPATAIRFSYSGGDVDFYQDEVAAVSLDHLADIAIRESQSQAPTIIYDGNGYQAFSMDFIVRDDGTAARIAEIKNAGEELTFYYQYAIDGGVASMSVIPLIDGDVEDWGFGELAANVMHKMNFLKSS